MFRNLVSLSKLDFALVNNFSCQHDFTQFKCKTDKGFLDYVFEENKGLTCATLDVICKTNFKVDNDEDAVRVSLLYVFTHSLVMIINILYII